MSIRGLRARPFGQTLAAVAVNSCFAAGTAAAASPVLPTGANPLYGIQSISQVGRSFNILTNARRSAANFDSFSIGTGYAVNIKQLSADSAFMGKVVGTDPSVIMGSMWSNGKVYLINPNGIVFGKGSKIDVGGLIASTLNLSDSDFLAGRLNFTGGLGKSVINEGSITTSSGGSVY